MKESIIREQSYAFALRVIALARQLRQKREYELAAQIIRAGTSVGANVEEALAGVSRPDFVSKMAIASMGARETHYWLRLLRDSKTIGSEQIDPVIEEAEELVRILTAIVKTGQRRGADRPTAGHLELKT